MRREAFIHFSFWFSIFVFISVVKRYFVLSYWPFWVGGIIGTILPDLDHVLHFYLIKPYELTSQRFIQMIKSREMLRSVQLLYETRSERKNLIFHSKFFQILFLVVTFWVMSSSGSFFGRGVALAFAIHLTIDQMMDIYEFTTVENKNERIYWLVLFILTLAVGLI